MPYFVLPESDKLILGKAVARCSRIANAIEDTEGQPYPGDYPLRSEGNSETGATPLTSSRSRARASNMEEPTLRLVDVVEFRFVGGIAYPLVERQHTFVAAHCDDGFEL